MIPGDHTRAAAAATIVLPSFADEQALFGDASPAATLARLHGQGAEEVIVKDGEAPIHFRVAGEACQAVAQAAIEALEASAARRGGEARFGDLAATFATATRLEEEFWRMGMELSA